MTDATQAITKTIPAIMAAGLIKHNLKKKRKKGILGLGVENITGISLIQATAQAGNW